MIRDFLLQSNTPSSKKISQITFSRARDRELFRKYKRKIKTAIGSAHTDGGIKIKKKPSARKPGKGSL